MNWRYSSILLLLFLVFTIGRSQTTYNIKFPAADRGQKCSACLQTFSDKPKEVGFSIQESPQGDLFFEINDESWFRRLFRKEGDGIAIDIVSKERYNCELPSIEKKKIKGKLLPPIYAKTLNDSLFVYPGNKYRVKVGELPAAYRDKDVEYNILFLNNYYLCQYYRIFDLDSYQWNLLDMGLYLDSLTYKNQWETAHEIPTSPKSRKHLYFVVPFEKDKSQYRLEDIKPIYDSLRLTDYTIKQINIEAYASVEGDLKRNVQLQQERAQSIVDALQEFQEPTIATSIHTSENWSEFFTDIRATPFEYLNTLDSSSIKQKLIGDLEIAIEPVLKGHRKAIVALELEQKDPYKNLSNKLLEQHFRAAITNEDLSTAAMLQNLLFAQLKGKQYDPDVLAAITLPKQRKYHTLSSKNLAFSYWSNGANLQKTYTQFKSLEKLNSSNGKAIYNRLALELHLWKKELKSSIDPAVLKREIHMLKKHSIPRALITRMLINFHIIESEMYMNERNYARKDKAVHYVNSNYGKIPLSDSDYLSLAQYLSFYSNYDKAIRLLKDKVKDHTVEESILFYYLNLTLVNDRLIGTSEYRKVLKLAIERNTPRFCRLFNPYNHGGIAFQLLDNPYLRASYCENCARPLSHETSIESGNR